MAEPASTRRSALEALTLALLAAAGLWRFLTPQRRRLRAARLVVAAADVPPEGALVLPQSRCAVVRRGVGVMALDLRCPHLGCTVAATERGFACPCHGSRFDSDGQVLEGPAARSLQALRVEERADVLLVSSADEEDGD